MDPLAQMELVGPQEEVACRDQRPVNAPHEPGDGVALHRLEGGPAPASALAFVPVGELFQEAAILRVEERHRDCRFGQQGEEL